MGDIVISHPPQEQLQDLEFCIDSNPPWDQTMILAFQNYILMLGTSVMIPSMLVPLMGGSNGDKARVIQTLLFVAGIKTLLQTLFGTRLPAIIGGSYAFVIPVLSIIGDPSLRQISNNQERFLQTMRAIQGAVIVASSLQIVIGYSQLWGIFSRFFSPLSMSPVMCLLGLGLLENGFPAVGKCVEIGIPMLLTVIAFCLYLKHIRIWKDTPVFERFSILLSIVIIWLYSYLLTVGGAYRHVPEKTKDHCRTDRAYLISSAPWFKFPYPLQWGAPTFNAGHSFAMMAAVIVSQIESTGAYIAASRFAMATPPPAYVLSRGIGWQGIGVLLDGLYGTATGSTVSIENVGLLGLSRVGSRRIIQVSAGFMIFFSILGKFGALFASIPFPIFAALYCVLFGLITSLGLSFLQFTNMNCMRNMFITGLSLFLGLSVPQYFNQFFSSSGHGPVHTRASWFDGFLNTVFSSAPTVALIVAIVLDNTVDVEGSKKDRGMPWWAKFRNFRGDVRNEEFYTLPFNLNRFFPPT
ncbi:nucleobase-ascorbate transporter 1-like [Magnolia sinica]|uniref:nucleobase-ascorbate transporter 1-like n=1 Tax=Magnolia sinica TaxID=86752 RepID=UPI00265A7B3A|nr:nucleobase-ascorbate transporter 1-like [Magnolia sinica]